MMRGILAVLLVVGEDGGTWERGNVGTMERGNEGTFRRSPVPPFRRSVVPRPPPSACHRDSRWCAMERRPP